MENFEVEEIHALSLLLKSEDETVNGIAPLASSGLASLIEEQVRYGLQVAIALDQCQQSRWESLHKVETLANPLFYLVSYQVNRLPALSEQQVILGIGVSGSTGTYRISRYGHVTSQAFTLKTKDHFHRFLSEKQVQCWATATLRAGKSPRPSPRLPAYPTHFLITAITVPHPLFPDNPLLEWQPAILRGKTVNDSNLLARLWTLGLQEMPFPEEAVCDLAATARYLSGFINPQALINDVLKGTSIVPLAKAVVQTAQAVFAASHPSLTFSLASRENAFSLFITEGNSPEGILLTALDVLSKRPSQWLKEKKNSFAQSS